MAGETVEVNVETAAAEANAEAAVAIAQIEANSIDKRIEALAEATAVMRGCADKVDTLREAFDNHVRSNESDFDMIRARLDELERGHAVMREALEAEAEVVEELVREEIRDELEEAEEQEEIEEIEEGESVALASGETPASVEAAIEEEPAPAHTSQTERKKRHLISLFGKRD